MDSIALRAALIAAIDFAKTPQDLPLILNRQGIETHFVRGSRLQEIEALNLKPSDQEQWLMSDALGPDLAWFHIATTKGWQPILATGGIGMSVATDPIVPPPANNIEVVLDLLAQQISPLVSAMRQLIIKLVNSVLIYSERTFGASLPRLKDTQRGVTRVPSSVEVRTALSPDCISETSHYLTSLLYGIRARDPVRFTLPFELQGMSEIQQALRDLKFQTNNTPAQFLQEQQALAQAELNEARKILASCRRERGEVVALVNDCVKGKRINDPKMKRQLMADADAKVKMAEHKVELVESRFPLLWHDQNGDAKLHNIEQPRG